MAKKTIAKSAQILLNYFKILNLYHKILMFKMCYN